MQELFESSSLIKLTAAELLFYAYHSPEISYNGRDVDYQKLIETGQQYYSDSAAFSTMMNEFNDSSKEMNKSISNIVDALEQVSSSVNDSANGVEIITIKTAEIAEKVVGVKSSTQNNLISSKKLKDQVSKFTF